MILVIDNYDSFVFNLARYVAELGYEYHVVRNDAITLDEISTLNPSHIIMSPGPCSPNEAGICLSLVGAFLHKLPLLGVCLGHQAIGQACGANVVRAKTPKHGKSSRVFHDGQGLFKDLPDPLQVARYHSLIVDEASLPSCLKVTARTAQNEIMGLAHKDYPVFGVQFHPESVLTEHGHAMLERFLKI
jgi:para-aminobenzoate synthetase component 2